MVIYVEYVFLQNFVLDGVLLYLSMRAAKAQISFKRLLFAAAVGGVFALVFPLFALPRFVNLILKLLFALPLCALCMKGIKTKKDRGMYAITVLFLYVFSFCFAGALFALTNAYAFTANVSLFTLCFSGIFSIGCIEFIKYRQKKRQIERFLYDCTLFSSNTSVRAQGFLDSGNLAKKNGIPVCFLSPELIFTLFERELFNEDGGHVCDEIAITTLNGIKNYPLYKGEIVIDHEKKQTKKMVYFAPSVHMLSKGYTLLLSASILDESNET